MITEVEKDQVDLYGLIPAGDETELELAKMARKQYLKKKFRPILAAEIGDYGDNITDAVRAIVLGQAILLGIETDSKIVDLYKTYINTMVNGYGGSAAIMSVLLESVNGLQQHLVSEYYAACLQIADAKTIEDVRMVDLPSEPEANAEL